MQVLVKPLGPHAQGQFHKDRVAAVLQGLRHGLGLVGTAPALDGVPIHLDLAGAVEAVLRRGHAAVQRSGSRQNLEGGAGLVGIGDQADAHQALQRVQLFPGRVVGVVIRLGTHGQHCAGIHVHHKGVNGLCLVDLVALPHGLFHDFLNGRVDGQTNGAAILRLNVEIAAVVDRAGFAVHTAHTAARFASKQRFVLLFQPGLAHAVHVHQAQSLGQKRAPQVDATDILVKQKCGCGRSGLRILTLL